MSTKNAAAPTTTVDLANRNVEPHRLGDLLLDPANPRFGGLNKNADQAQVTEFIVKQFGVDDVLASLATNGYFQSEPLVARRDGQKLVVVEGNRRLAACLILARDPRAKDVAHLRPEHVKQDWSPETQVPVLVFDESEQGSLLPYLGVRHIVGSQPWDSYAKARWIDEVVSKGQMTLEDIESAIGDTNRTITRMLDGYRFVQQLKDSGDFKPDQSQRRGKGSNTEFPFSWVYTLLDYSNVRDYLGLPPRAEAKKRPIPATALPAAAKSLVYMFGDDDRSPAIRNSRDISDLANALSDPIKREMLEKGASIEQINERSRTPSERLSSLFLDAELALKTATGILAEGSVDPNTAQQLVPIANGVRNLAGSLFKSMQEAAYPSDHDADQ